MAKELLPESKFFYKNLLLVSLYTIRNSDSSLVHYFERNHLLILPYFSYILYFNTRKSLSFFRPPTSSTDDIYEFARFSTKTSVFPLKTLLFATFPLLYHPSGFFSSNQFFLYCKTPL